MFDCRIAAVRRSAPLPAPSRLQRSLAPSSPGGTASPLPVRGRIDLAAGRRTICARVVTACPSFSSGGINSRRLHHAQDRFQHTLEVGDLLLELLPPRGRQFVEAGGAGVLRLSAPRLFPPLYLPALQPVG